MFALLLLLAAIALIAALALVIMLIYKPLYNRHINGESTKKWPSPLAVGIAAFLTLAFVAAAAGVLHVKNPATYIKSDGPLCLTYAEGDPDLEQYPEFRGRDVDGYDISDKNKGSFSYTLFEKTDAASEDRPDYVIVIRCNGSEFRSCGAFCEIRDRFGGESSGTALENADAYYVFIWDSTRYYNENGAIDGVRYSLSYTLKLYDLPVGSEQLFDESSTVKPLDQITIRLK